jgi:hypothetical protein
MDAFGEDPIRLISNDVIGLVKQKYPGLSAAEVCAGLEMAKMEIYVAVVCEEPEE